MRQIERLLFEAYRRNDMADGHERAKVVTNRWLGLGTEAAYRPAIQAGLMRWHDGRTPPVRCMGWLCLTEKGAETMAAMAADFARALADIKRDTAYQDGYKSRFQLAGGLDVTDTR